MNPETSKRDSISTLPVLQEVAPHMSEKDLLLVLQKRFAVLKETYGSEVLRNYVTLTRQKIERDAEATKPKDSVNGKTKSKNGEGDPLPLLRERRESLRQGFLASQDKNEKRHTINTYLEKKFFKYMNELTRRRGNIFNTVDVDEHKPHIRTRLQEALQQSIDQVILAFPSRRGLSDSDTTPEFPQKIYRFAKEKYELLFKAYFGFFDNPLIRSIDDEGKVELFKNLLNDVLYPHYPGEIVMGYGGSDEDEDLQNVRLPSYVLPPLLSMRNLIKAGFPNIPRLRVVNAQAIAAHFNEMDKTTTRKNGEYTNALLRAFVDHFFPDCSQYVDFTMPELNEFINTDVYRKCLKIMKNYFNNLSLDEKETIRLLHGAAAHHRETRNTPLELLTPSQLITLTQSYLGYTTCHAVEVCFGDIRSPVNIAQKPYWTIKPGGEAEEAFDEMEYQITNHDWSNPNEPTLGYRVNTSKRHERNDGVGFFRSVPIRMRVKVGSNPPPYYNVKKSRQVHIRINNKLCVFELKNRGEICDAIIGKDTQGDPASILKRYDTVPELKGAKVDIKALETHVGWSEYVKFLNVFHESWKREHDGG